MALKRKVLGLLKASSLWASFRRKFIK